MIANENPAREDLAAPSETWDRYWRSGDPGYASHQDITGRVVKLTDSEDIVVEVGSGLGVDAVEISRSDRSVIALDLSREALRLMKSKTVGLSVFPVLADAMALPFKDNSVDLIFHQGVMEHFRDLGSFLAQQKKVLKTGGFLIADVPQMFTLYTIRKRWAIFRNKWFAGWETQYSPGQLRRMLSNNGFHVKEIYGRDYDLNPLIWIRDIEKLGSRRFGHPIIPKIIRGPVSALWKFWEKRKISNYIKHCVGAVAVKE